MVRLRLGRFAWELYYTRTRAQLPREEFRRRVALIFGHLGYITGLGEYAMTDMLALRFFAMSGCLMIVGYQCAQPKILKLSAGWNSLYAAINLYHIYLLKKPYEPLSEEAQLLHEALGGAEKVPLGHFHQLLRVGHWRYVEAGTVLTEDDEAVEDEVPEANTMGSQVRRLLGREPKPGGPEVLLIASGQCDVFVHNMVVARLGPGSVLGEVGAVASRAGEVGAQREIPPRNTTVIASEGGMRFFCVALNRLEYEPELRDALQGIFAAALAEKVVAMSSETKIVQYAAVLEMACHPGIPEHSIQVALAEFRRKHLITDEEHDRVVQSLPDWCRQSPILSPDSLENDEETDPNLHREHHQEHIRRSSSDRRSYQQPGPHNPRSDPYPQPNPSHFPTDHEGTGGGHRMGGTAIVDRS
mmetsp:Transcript_6006/g.13932  ORF Transcript_6006/g.13932 Transcript_6006/m.13932 type:complete len:414 (-) Transcript_6006:24-1265(-)